MASSEGTAPGTAQAASASTAASASASEAGAAAGGPAGIWPRRDAAGHQASSGATSSLDGFRVDCLMNARYHSAREAFLDGVHRWLMLCIILFGSAAVLNLFGDWLPEKYSTFLKAVFAALPVIFGTLDLTFDLSNRARIHALMKRRYFELLADVTEGKKTIEQADAAMHRCSADEEPAYHALIASAWNAAQVMVYGDRAKRQTLTWCERAGKQFFRFEGSRFPVMEGAAA
jgi:hypothetical protein